MKTDMSPEAITERLKLTSELRRLCLALMENSYVEAEQRKQSPQKTGN